MHGVSSSSLKVASARILMKEGQRSTAALSLDC